MGLKKLIKTALVNKNNTRYQKELAGRLCSYHAWIAGEEAGYASASVADEEEKYLVIFNPKGRLSENAHKWIGLWFSRCPKAVLIYGDEDVWVKGQERMSPLFKPDWSPDLLEQQFYFGGVAAVRKSWLAEQSPELLKKWELADCELSSKEECHKLVMQTVELAGGYEGGMDRERIVHIPRILFHNESEADRSLWMSYKGTKPEHFGEKFDGLLSVIIPSKDNPYLLKQCIGSILEDTSGIKYEIIVVDNGSRPENRRQIEAVLHRFRQAGSTACKRILYHYDAQDFNFSKMCNLGVKKSSGEVLLFLNDDVTLAQKGTLERMTALATRPFAGAVGLKLVYPCEEDEDRRIQHAGITNLPMGPVHKLQFCKDNQEYYLGRNRGRHNMLAVTAACLMVEKSKFTEIGGFAEELAVAFNDVDLCYSLFEHGYENVCECDWFAYHDESFSRGDDEAPEKLARLLKEREKLYKRHPKLEGTDPYYSVYLNREGLDTRIRPCFESGKNMVQTVEKGADKGFVPVEEQELLKCREDACLMVRAESVLRKEELMTLTGWSVVLGDDNACYDWKLLLKDSEGGCHGLDLQGQYRPDLIENMPDQTNVGLCGFWLEWEEGVLPAGSYLLGVMAKNRVNGMGLINWSNRMVEV